MEWHFLFFEHCSCGLFVGTNSCEWLKCLMRKQHLGSWFWITRPKKYERSTPAKEVMKCYDLSWFFYRTTIKENMLFHVVSYCFIVKSRQALQKLSTRRGQAFEKSSGSEVIQEVHHIKALFGCEEAANPQSSPQKIMDGWSWYVMVITTGWFIYIYMIYMIWVYWILCELWHGFEIFEAWFCTMYLAKWCVSLWMLERRLGCRENSKTPLCWTELGW